MSEAKYEDKPEFPGGGRLQNKKPFAEKLSMEILWNCTFYLSERSDISSCGAVSGGFLGGDKVRVISYYNISILFIKEIQME